MSQRINLSLKELLGSSYHNYIANAVLPEIQRLAEQGKITPFELRKIRELISQKGIDVLSPQLRVLNEVTLNSAANDGCIFEAELPLTSEVSIRHVIKQSSQREDYDKAVELQENVRRTLRSTEYAHVVPPQVYTNQKQRIIVTPFVEGTTLKDKLKSETPEEREQTLREVIDQYVGVFRHLNQPNVRTGLEFPAQLQDFNAFFVNTYLDGQTQGHEELVGAYERNIGNCLNAERGSVAHGDFHPGNILINGHQTYIDWPKATSNGFPEFDLATVIRKSDLDPDLEERVITYATEKLTDDQNKQRQSKELLTKELIKRDLIASKRYLQSAEKTDSEEVKTRMHQMAVIAYNSAVRRIKRAQEEGTVNSNLLEAIIQNPPEARNIQVGIVDDHTYDELRKQSNPYCAMTQEHMEPKQPLTDLVQTNLDDEIKGLRKTVKWQYAKRLLRNIGIGILGLGVLAAGTIGLLKYGDIKQEETRKVIAEQNFQLHIQAYYSGTFQEAFEKLKVGILDGKIKTKLPLDSKEIDEIAQSYNIDPELLRNIMRVNRYNAGIGIAKINGYTRINDLNLLDPFSYVEIQVAEPLENLRAGVRRLSNLIKESNGDVSEAVYRFYDPTYPSDSKYSPGLTWRHGTINREDIETIRTEQCKSAYNALNGLAVEYKGGDSWYYLKQPLKTNPPTGISKEDCEQKCSSTYQGQLYTLTYDTKSCVYSCTPKKVQSQEQRDCFEKCKEYPRAGPAGGACELRCESL